MAGSSQSFAFVLVTDQIWLQACWSWSWALAERIVFAVACSERLGCPELSIAVEKVVGLNLQLL